MKIAILGTENSHAYEFAKLIRNNPKYGDVEIAGVYGYDAAANQRLLDEGLVPYSAKTPDEFLGKVDGIVVTARHGDLHHDYAMPYLRAGVPAFIDKPFAIKPEYAAEMVDAARGSGAMICGGSSLKYLDELNSLRRFAASKKVVGGCVTAPVSMTNEYGGFYFYSQHLVEIMFAVFGMDVHGVYARRGRDGENRVSVIFDYGDFDVTALFYDSYTYTAAVFAKEGCRTSIIQEVTYCYELELDAFCNMVRSGRMETGFDALTRPAALLRMIEQSYTEQREIRAQW